MKLYCIADEDTVRGFRLAGVDGQSVATARQAAEALEQAVGDPDLGVLIVTDVVAQEVRPQIDAIRLGRERPLIAEIPSPEGPMKGRKTLRQFVQEAVGIRVGGD